MFGNKFATAHARISALAAMVAATGFRLDAEAETIPTLADFQGHLESRDLAAAQAAAKPVLAARLAAEAQAGAYRSGLEGAGIKLDLAAGDFTAPKEGEAVPAVAKIKTGVETAIAQRSVRQVAAAGHPAAVDTPPAAEAGDFSAADAVPANAADFMATHRALLKKDPRAANAYFRKHEARFPVR